MSKISIQTEVDIKTFLSGAAHLQLKELEAFAKELNGIITQKKRKTKAWKKGELLAQINHTVLSQEERERYALLSKKLHENTLTEEEHQEHLTLGTLQEQYRNQRVAAMIKLAKLKNQTLPELMKELGITPQTHV